MQFMQEMGDPKLTIGDLAKYLRVNRSLLSRYLSGGILPSYENAIRIANKWGDEYFDIIEMPRANSAMDKIVEDVLERLPELKERNPALFNELLAAVKDLDEEEEQPRPARGQNPRPAQNGA